MRAGYGEELLALLSKDLTAKQGRGFSRRGLRKMRAYHLGWEIRPTSSGESETRKGQTLSAESARPFAPVPILVQPGFTLLDLFPLMSPYVRLMAFENSQARAFYEVEDVPGGPCGSLTVKSVHNSTNVRRGRNALWLFRPVTIDRNRYQAKRFRIAG